MNPVGYILFGVAYGFLSGNAQARNALGKQLSRFSGMAIDSLNRQGGDNVQPPTTTTEEPKE